MEVHDEWVHLAYDVRHEFEPSPRKVALEHAPEDASAVIDWFAPHHAVGFVRRAGVPLCSFSVIA